MAHSLRDRFRDLGRDAMVFGLANALSRSALFILLPIYTRVFEPAEFAVLDLAAAGGAVLNLVIQFELNQALMRYFGGISQEQRRVLFSTIYWFAAATGTGVALVGSLASVWIANRTLGDPDASIAVWLVLWTAALASLGSLASAQLRMEAKVRRAATVQIVSVLSAVVLILVMVLVLDWGIAGALGGALAGAVLSSLLGTFWVRRYLALEFDSRVIRRALAFSFPLIPAVGAGYLRRYADRFVILAMLGPTALGVYALGAKLSAIPEMAVQAFRQSWVPVAMRLIGDAHQSDVYERALRYYALLIGTLGFAVVTVSPELVAVIGTSSYDGAETVVGWLVGAGVVMGAGSYLAVGAMVAERTSIHWAATWAGAASTFGAMFVAAPVFGMQGVAMGAFAGSLVTATVLYRLAQRVYPIPFRVLRLLAVTALFVLLLATAFTWSGGLPPAPSLAVRGAALLVYALASFRILLLPAERMVVRGLIRGRMRGTRVERGAARSTGPGAEAEGRMRSDPT